MFKKTNKKDKGKNKKAPISKPEAPISRPEGVVFNSKYLGQKIGDFKFKDGKYIAKTESEIAALKELVARYPNKLSIG